MSFHPKQLPTTVRRAFQEGPIAWIFIVKTAIQENIRDINKLTDMVFYLHNPELIGRQLRVGETKLIAEWKRYRALIRLVQSKWDDLSWRDDRHCDCPHDLKNNL